MTSIVVTIGIVVILAHESKDFFAHVSLAEFLGSTQWTPIIGEPKSYGVWPLLSATLHHRGDRAGGGGAAGPPGRDLPVRVRRAADPARSSSRPSSFWQACRRSCSATSRSRC
jgi:hypothetical protein